MDGWKLTGEELRTRRKHQDNGAHCSLGDRRRRLRESGGGDAEKHNSPALLAVEGDLACLPRAASPPGYSLAPPPAAPLAACAGPCRARAPCQHSQCAPRGFEREEMREAA
uniref:Uncharacterized protein n=1 Tax=Leersia perrieri TaxID=77586 RepID=A0A0D9WGN8_9ORYZ